MGYYITKSDLQEELKRWHDYVLPGIKEDIDNGIKADDVDYISWFDWPLGFNPAYDDIDRLTFDPREAGGMIGTAMRELIEEFCDYEEKVNARRARKRREEEERREREEQRRREEEEERERERKKMERKEKEKQERERKERERREQKQQEDKQRREQSLGILTESPYNFSAAEAEKYISTDGSINKEALARFENSKRNQEYLAKKEAEWKTKKARQNTVPPLHPQAPPQPVQQNRSQGAYYDANKATLANARPIQARSDEQQHFPKEGLYLGELKGGTAELPALFDLTESKGLCFLYNNERDRKRINLCLERLAWRLAMTLPSNLCDLILYNGGNPGDAFSAHARINKYVCGNRKERVFFEGNADAFTSLVNDIYGSIAERMSTIRLAGKNSLQELNESLGNDARLKYTFLVITDFPRHIKTDLAIRLSQIVEAGNKAGVYVLMSWDMNADLEDVSLTSSFNHQKMICSMEFLSPQDGRFYFHNSGHDELFNKFDYAIDDTLMGVADIEQCLSYIDTQVEIARKQSRPTILKQDFEELTTADYVLAVSEISVTVGADLFDKHPVTLRFNSGDYIHTFILGQSGTGKSVFLNNIITSAILKYSPQDLMLYLMDFKGVEFNRYRGVKHTKAVLVDNSDPQMTLEVLRELKEENRKRVKLWQREQVSNIDGYNRLHPDKRLPQVLFVADECQIMFKESPQGTERLIQQEIQEILNIIATQGRSQGIHMLLATQQLDETDIPGQILKNLTECFLFMSSPSDSERLVPDSSMLTSKQMTGVACYYHKRELQSQMQAFYASNDELATAIGAAQQKAANCSGNGGHYFCGSTRLYLTDNLEFIRENTFDCPVALVGQNISIDAGATTIPLRRDYMEHILFWGANKEEQTTGVMMNALVSLILSYKQQGVNCNFIVIDCMPYANSWYKHVLAELVKQGLCRLVERRLSGAVLKKLIDDINYGIVEPTVLAIIGSERFEEIKRKKPLISTTLPSVPSDDEIEEISFDMSQFDFGDSEAMNVDTSKMTYPQALMYLLEEGPIHDVHMLLQIDKPSNILFGDEYEVEAALKFRHKVILKSENKLLHPFRFSQDIDVEMLSDEDNRLRAYYYPEGDSPALFTPYQMLEENDLLNIK